MAKLVLTLAVISLLATWLQVSSAKPVVPESGYVDKEGNEDDMIGLETSDDEEYNSGSGSGSESGSEKILILTQEEIWKLFQARLKKLGYSLNPTEAPSNSTEAPSNPTEAPSNPTEAPSHSQ